MKRICFVQIAFLLASLLSINCFAQREVTLKRSLIVKCPNPEYLINRCSYALLVPANRAGKQEILEYKYSIPPDRVTKTEAGEYYIQWKSIVMAQLKATDLDVTMRVKMKIYDLQTAKKQPVKDLKDLDTNLYLKDEENFRIKAKNIKEAAATITANTREEITKEIFNYVLKSLDYHIYFFQDRGAKKALKDGKGDCTEYSELMITLCRAKKIPARIVMGLIPKNNGAIGYHNWVEVYFPQYGWVAFDPTWADHPKATTTFYVMKNAYIQLSYQRHVDVGQCSCKPGDFPFSIALRDTSFDKTSRMINQMQIFYKSNELQKADLLLDTLLLSEPDNSRLLTYKGMINARQNNFDKAKEYLDNAVKNSETDIEKYSCLYAYSNFYALKGDGDNAVKTLKEAIDLGFDRYDHIEKDVDFEKIKSFPAFVELINELKEKEKNKK